MPMRHIFTLLAVGLPAFVFAAVENADSVAVSHELEEVVVTGERAWIEGNKAVFVPTRHEKNLATSPATLVERMNIPTVIVNNGVITTLRGKGVPIYINGVEATDIDLETFWPKQTYRVEYIDHPTDPVYKGAEAVLNFVMTEYEVGGVTKANAMQTFPNEGRYSLSSKLVYKKMTYGVLVGGDYSRDHSDSYTGEESYQGVWYDGALHDAIKRSMRGHAWSRSENVDVALNARYLTDNVRITHSAGLKWNRNPGSGSESSDSWSPSLFVGDRYEGSDNSRSLSPSLSGNYAWWNAKMSVVGAWNYSHSHNNRSSLSCMGESGDIANGTREDVNSLGASLGGSYQLRPRMAVWLQLQTSMDWYTTRYTGSADMEQRQWRGGSRANLSFRWGINDKFFVNCDPGLTLDYWRVHGHESHTRVSPKAELNLMYAPGTKVNMMAYVAYFNHAPSAGQSGDVTIRQDELNWISSNPDLGNAHTWLTGMHVMWLPLRWLRATAILHYDRHDNEFMTIYKAAPPQMGGVLRTYANARPRDSYGLDLILGGNLFGNRLDFHLQPVFQYSKTRGEYATDLFWFRMRGSAGLNLGNFRLGAWYGGAEKYLADGGMTCSWHGADYGLDLTYGNGDIYVDLGVANIFNPHRESWRKVHTQVYEYRREGLSKGFNVSLRLTYTFGYGKKVDRNIDITGPEDAKSGALGYE